MKNENPLVSIIIPVYNKVDFVDRLFKTLTSQTYVNIEIIAVDDGSEDGSRELIKKYALKYKNIKLFSGRHKGANVARGIGVKNAEGKFLMFVDADDWIEKDAVEKLVGYMSKNPDVDIVRYNAKLYPSGNLKNPYILPNDESKILTGSIARRILATEYFLNNLCFQFYRAELFKGVKSFNVPYSNCEDYLVNIDVYDRVSRIMFVGDVLYYYYENPNSTTKTFDAKRITKNINELVSVHLLMLEKLDKWSFSKEEKNMAIVATLEKIRNAVYSLFYNKKINKKKFILILEGIFKKKDYKKICKMVNANKAYIEDNKTLMALKDCDAKRFWRLSILRRLVYLRRAKKTVPYIAKYMRGRLGNQLFQYATIRQIQETNGEKDKIYLNFSKYVYSLGFKNELVNFRVRPYKEVDKIKLSSKQKIVIFVNKAEKRIYRAMKPDDYKRFRYDFENKKAKSLEKSGLYWKEDGAIEINPTKAKKKLAIGHFESAKNFDSIRDLLMYELQPIEPPLEKNKKLYDVAKNCESVCISIRRGDYVENPEFSKNFNTCGLDYFKKATEEIKKHVKNPVFIIFSDDIKWCKKNIRLWNEKVYYEDGDDPVWEKLRLMYSCKHFIISNSTFSWWAQYLSRNEKKVVVAPKKWTNFGYDKDIYDESWILVDNSHSLDEGME